MSAASWFFILLALVCANLPFASERLFCLVALRTPVKGVMWRMGECVVLYGVMIMVGFALEAHGGNRTAQGWAFYVITCCVFAVFAFPGFCWCYLVNTTFTS